MQIDEVFGHKILWIWYNPLNLNDQITTKI